MKITEELLEAIKILGEYQIAKNVYVLFDITPLIGFEQDDTLIINPFIDECGWSEVNPIEYYGEAFLNSDFLKIDIEDIDKYRNTEIIVFLDGKEEFNGMSFDFLDINEYNEEVENMVFEAIINKYSKATFSSGVWEVYTKEGMDK